ncbi:DotA/TraY family protein [Thiotrichales bacterium 19S3-7]|nr:DotA/TraY family protein [Thiotrichales bacterium 19S3-7]MCF6800794.1 DotA/TraY family protein [Thiotrichales bacterium 19S3-11]
MSSTIWGTVPVADQSQDILKTVFGGDVTTLLTDVNTTLFSVTFKYFNTGLLAITFVLYAFILIIGTINTAKDGQFLGKNWSGHWISLRAIFGTIFAVPLQTGYCVAQYLIFAMVTAGISFADYVWAEVVGNVVDGNVPPVVSSEVSNNINTYLATYMMSNLTQDLLTQDMFYSGNPAACTKTSQPINVKVPQYTTVDGKQQLTGYKTVSEPSDLVTCNVNYSTPATSGFVKTYQAPLADAVEVGGSSKPFSDYASILGQGLTSWSKVEGDQYVQFQLNTTDWIGTFKVNQMYGQPTDTDVQKILNEYNAGGNSGYLFVNLVADPNALNSYGANAMSGTSSAIINTLEKQTGSITQACDYTDKNNLCYQAKNYGWWDADQLYLTFDNALSQNLQNLYNNFQKLSSAASKVANQTSIPVDYSKIKVHYLENSNSISSLLSSDPDVSFKPLTGSQYEHVAEITDLKTYEQDGKLNNTGSFATSMSGVRALFNEIIKASNKSDDTKTQLTGEVNSLLTDGMQYQYANYVYIIYSLTNSVWSSYTGTGNDKATEASTLVDTIIRPVLNLFSFFYANGVDFGANKDPIDTSSVTDPAQQLLTKIFDMMGTNTSSSEAGGLLEQIYNIGTVPDGEESFAAQNFSMVQNVQAVGMALIEGTINSMIGIFSHAKDELQQIQNSAKQQFGEAEDNAKGYAVANAFTLGLFGSTFSAQTNLEFAKAMFDVTMQLATFSLSLMWLPLIIFVLSSIFSIGISFSLVIPLTPYILFWAGKTAWLLLVIEAMAAAPFVSLGLVYPEGHEVFGKAEPGIQICMNLVLRPVFMILGMIFGIGLTYVVIQYSAAGFHAITDSLLNLMPASDGTDAASYARGTFSCMIIFMYATFLSMAFMKCFSLIYVIPDKVLQWIGNTRGDRAGEAEIQEFKGAAQSYGQGAAQAGGQTMSQGIEAEKSYTSSYAQGQKDVSQSTAQRNMAISNDSAGVAKQAGEAALMM